VKRVIDYQWAKREALKEAKPIIIGSETDPPKICPLVFHRKGKRIKSYRRRGTRRESAGCPGRLLHDFRRTAVRNLERRWAQCDDRDHRPQDRGRVSAVRYR